jgi:peptidoglycan/LPS O-acetylase OafA/YrhL
MGGCVCLYVRLIWVLRGRPLGHWLDRLGRHLAAISFSLYAIHYPICALLGANFYPRRISHAGAFQWTMFLIMLGGILAVASAFWWLFARNTPRVRKWLSAAILSAPTRSVA